MNQNFPSALLKAGSLLAAFALLTAAPDVFAAEKKKTKQPTPPSAIKTVPADPNVTTALPDSPEKPDSATRTVTVTEANRVAPSTVILAPALPDPGVVRGTGAGSDSSPASTPAGVTTAPVVTGTTVVTTPATIGTATVVSPTTTTTIVPPTTTTRATSGGESSAILGR